MASTLITLASLVLGPVPTVAGPTGQQPTTNGIGRAVVINHCEFPVTLWSVGGSLSGPSTLAAQNGQYAEQFVVDPATGGKALKITRDADGLFGGKAQTIYAYTLAGNQVYYDLSSVFGDAVQGKKLVVSSADASCPSIIWPSGSTGSQVKSCSSNFDVILTLCAA